MTDFLQTMLPLVAFMLIPLWIPMIAVAVGGLFDAIGRVRAVGDVTASPVTLAQQLQPSA